MGREGQEKCILKFFSKYLERSPPPKKKVIPAKNEQSSTLNQNRFENVSSCEESIRESFTYELTSS